LGYAEVRRDTAKASAAWHSALPVPAVFAPRLRARDVALRRRAQLV